MRRSRDGVQTTEIELAEKILDCDGECGSWRIYVGVHAGRAERIRNTLSHEMCHLACWIINGDPKENHGKAFHSW